MNQVKLQALADMLQGVPAAKLKALIEGHTTKATAKALTEGIRFKSEPLYQLPDGRLAVLKGGQLFAVKAEQLAPAMAEEEALDEEVEIEEDAEGDFAGDMPVEAFRQMIIEAVQEALATEVKMIPPALPKPKKAPAATVPATKARPWGYANAGDSLAAELGLA